MTVDYCNSVLASLQKNTRKQEDYTPKFLVPSRPILLKKLKTDVKIHIKQLNKQSEEFEFELFDLCYFLKKNRGKLLKDGKGLADLKTCFDYELENKTLILYPLKSNQEKADDLQNNIPVTVPKEVEPSATSQEPKTSMPDAFDSKLKELLQEKYGAKSSEVILV